MIEKVVVCDIRRGGELISEIEINQMAGRAGRSYKNTGEAVLLVARRDYQTALTYFNDTLPDIKSSLNVVNIAFHILPIIESQKFTKILFNEWYEKTLAFHQGLIIDYNEVKNYLLSNEMLNGDLTISNLGKLSIRFYYTPERVYILFKKLNDLTYMRSFDNDGVVSWVLAHKELKTGKIDEGLTDLFDDSLCGMVFNYHEYKHALCYFCILNKYNPKTLSYYIGECRKDIGRTFALIKAMSECFDWEFVDQIDIMRTRFIQRVEYDVAVIMKTFDLQSKKLAYWLYDNGIKTMNDLNNRIDVVSNFADGTILKLLKEQLLCKATSFP